MRLSEPPGPALDQVAAGIAGRPRKAFNTEVMKTCAWILVLFSGARLAANPDVSLIPPAGVASPGETMVVKLALLNPGLGEERVQMPAVLAGRLESGEASLPVELRADDATETSIAPGGFVARAYALTIPAAAHGRSILELESPWTVRAVVDVASPARAAAPAVTPAALPASAAPASGGSMLQQVPRTFAGHFAAHYPIYFLMGPDKPAAKFQFSFKYLIVGDQATYDPPRPPMHALYFGYTQRSVWDITASSSPFYDTSYMPELMFEDLTPSTTRDDHGGLHWLGYQASVQHESNGRAEPQSRSTNLVYVRPMIGFGRPSGWWVVFEPKIYFNVGGLSDNPNLPLYRGYVEYYLAVTKSNRLSLALTGRVGNHWDKGSIQADLTYPLKAPLGGFATYLILQYFNGYGESILDYDQKSSTARVGVSLVR